MLACYFNSIYVHRICSVHSGIYVTRSDKKGLIAGKYLCLLNNPFLYSRVTYNNSVCFTKISVNVYVSYEKFKYLSCLQKKL